MSYNSIQCTCHNEIHAYTFNQVLVCKYICGTYRRVENNNKKTSKQNLRGVNSTFLIVMIYISNFKSFKYKRALTC